MAVDKFESKADMYRRLAEEAEEEAANPQLALLKKISDQLDDLRQDAKQPGPDNASRSMLKKYGVTTANQGIIYAVLMHYLATNAIGFI